jgi:hypothetical protein
MENGQVIDIYKVEETKQEIQVTTEKCFDLLMSAPITMSSLRERLGFLSNTEFTMNMLRGEVHIPTDVDHPTTIVIKEIMCQFQALHKGHAKVSLGTDEFQYYWKRVQEKTSSAISTIHFGHYKLAMYFETVTKFLAKKITLIARGGCPPDCWGHGLQILLEKIGGVALVTKLCAILLMEGDFNYMNKWIFGHEAINKPNALGYVPRDQYSQKESTAEDAWTDNRLTMDISRQLWHPLATMSADADTRYNRINHIIMSLLLLAIVGCIGNIVSMFHLFEQ